MVEGTIMEWKAPEGASVSKGDVIMEYQNEKNTIEYEALEGGILHIIAQEGDTVEVGGLIAMLAADQAEYGAMTAGTAPANPQEAPAPAAAVPQAASVPSAAAVQTAAPTRQGVRVRATGLAKKMARAAGVDIADVPASGGPDGARIVARDVTAYLEAKKAAPTAGASAAAPVFADADEITETRWTGVRKAIARNMHTSLQDTAQCTCVCEMDITELLALRRKLVEQAEFLGCRVTVNDFLCKAVAKTLLKHPLANATFDGQTLFSHKHVNLSVAVATENGLMVPVVRHADALSLIEFSKAVKDLGRRARERKLRDGEQSGGTFTVTNVGMFPIDFATPILNPPEVGIMGFGRTSKRPVWIDGQFVPRDMMHAFFTFDHRVIDGLEVGRVFQDLQTLVEHPALILA